MVDSLKLIIKKNNLNLLFIFKNYFSLISLISFLILGWILVVIFVPVSYGGAQNMIVQIYMLLILGVLSYQWSNSTLKNNEVISGVGRTKHYLSLLLTIFIIGNILSFILLLGDVLLFKIGILSRNWPWEPGKFEGQLLYFGNVKWYLVFYIFQLNILVTFSVYFFANRFFSNKRSYYIFLMFLAIFLILFGGSLNNWFQKSLYFNSNYDVNKNINLGFEVVGDGTTVFPKYIFLPTSLLFPFYNVNQFYSTLVLQMLNEKHSFAHSFLLSDLKSYTPFLLDFNNPDHWQWSLVIIMPYIHIVIFFILGMTSSKIKTLTK